MDGAVIAATRTGVPLRYDDEVVRRILRETRTIAMVGASPKWVRPSNFVMKYLQGKGYRVIPVNPGVAGTAILGEMTRASLDDIDEPVEMVDIFRASDAAAGVVDKTIALKKRLGIQSVWMQLGVRHDDAAQRAEDAGLQVIMNRCIKIEYGRLCNELGWQGVNSGIISAKRPRRQP